MTDTDLQTKLEELRANLSSAQSTIENARDYSAQLKYQIKEFEKELKRREKWAEKTNA